AGAAPRAPPRAAAAVVPTRRPRGGVVAGGGPTCCGGAAGIRSAVAQAREAAGDRDVAIAGGAATINQALAAGLLDELRLHVVPQVLGFGDRVLDGVPPHALETVAVRAASLVTHVTNLVVGALGSESRASADCGEAARRGADTHDDP